MWRDVTERRSLSVQGYPSLSFSLQASWVTCSFLDYLYSINSGSVPFVPSHICWLCNEDVLICHPYVSSVTVSDLPLVVFKVKMKVGRRVDAQGRYENSGVVIDGSAMVRVYIWSLWRGGLLRVEMVLGAMVADNWIRWGFRQGGDVCKCLLVTTFPSPFSKVNMGIISREAP